MSGREDLPAGVALREEVEPGDVDAVRALVRGTGFFNDDEVRIAAELVAERLARGPASGYEFVLLEAEGQLLGYSCYGRVDGTAASWDLYWIAVRKEARGAGWGRHLLGLTEARIAAQGGGRVWVETAGRPHYAPTRAFYEACGYVVAATLRDFYANGDDKVVYVRDV